MFRPLRRILGTLTVLLLGLTYAIHPLYSDAPAAYASTCTPADTTYLDGGTTYSILAFKSTSSCNWVVPSGVSSADLLLVGGGGAAGNLGAGGAGEFVEKLNQSVSGTIAVQTGAGGAAGGSNRQSGFPTSFGGVTAAGGGRGGYDSAGQSSPDGASGCLLYTSDAADE